MESLPNSIRVEVFSDENEQVILSTTMLMSQKCEISSEDIPLMKSKSRYDPYRRPNQMRFRMGAQMANSRILVR